MARRVCTQPSTCQAGNSLGALAVLFCLAVLSATSPHASYAAFPGANGKLSFGRDQDGSFFDVYVMNADGSGQTNLTNNPAEDSGGVNWQSLPILDHFKCYKAEGNSVDLLVDLDDQFGTEPEVRVYKPRLFCNPVDKNGEGIRDPETHLTCYEIEGDEEFDERDVLVGNQFGDQTLEVEKPELLCVPSEQREVILKSDD